MDSNEVGEMRRQPLPSNSSEPQEPSPAPVQSAPPPGYGIGMGHPEFHFVTGLMDVQKQLGEIKASIETLTKTVDSTKSKVDDLVSWKNRILGGAIAIGAVLALLGWGITKFSSYVTIKAPDAPSPTAAAAPATTAASPATDRPAQK